MASEAKRTTQLPSSNSVLSNAQLVMVSGGNTVLVELGNLTGNSQLIKTVSAPANSAALTIAAGAMLTDGSYLYLATSNNVLKRVALSSF